MTAELVKLGPLAETFLRKREEVILLDDGQVLKDILIAQLDTLDAERIPVPQRNRLQIESQTLSETCCYYDFAVIVYFLDIDEFVAFAEDNRVESRLADSRELFLGDLHNHTLTGCEEQELAVIELGYRNNRGNLLVIEIEQIDDGFAFALPRRLGDVVDLEPVDSAFAGEAEEIIVRGGDKDALDEILVLCRHADDTATAAVLTLVGVQRHRLDVVVGCQGDKHLLVLDEILLLEVVDVGDDLCPSLVAVFLADLGCLALDFGEDVSVVRDDEL